MLELYIDDNRIIVVREGVSIIINDASFVLASSDEQTLAFRGYGKTMVTTIAGDEGKRAGLESYAIGVEYKIGESYSGRELLKIKPPEGTIVLDDDEDALKLEDGRWVYGAEDNPIIAVDEYTILYLPN